QPGRAQQYQVERRQQQGADGLGGKQAEGHRRQSSQWGVQQGIVARVIPCVNAMAEGDAPENGFRGFVTKNNS
ncbi:MAG: hypothetical protein ACM34A_19445, partial [Bacillota bacterium]